MRQILLTYLLCLFLSNFCFSQICGSCDFSTKYDLDSRFWEDPSGQVYGENQIWVPDVIGTWTFFKLSEDNVRENLFVREVNCIGNLEPRNKRIQYSELTIFPNPVEKELTVSHTYTDGTMFITDAKGVFMTSKSITNPESFIIDVSSFSKGLYLIHYEGKGLKTSHLFIVQ